MKKVVKNTIISTLCFGPAALANIGLAQAQPPPPPPANSHALAVVVDLSGSMGDPVETSEGCMSKLDVVKKLATDWVEEKATTTAPHPANFSVWTFSGSEYRLVQGFSPDKADALSAIKNLVDEPDGSTPLAMTACDVADELRLFDDSPLTARHIYLATDGLENSTPKDHKCAKERENTGFYPNYTPGSWQWKVRNYLIGGNPNSPIADNIDHGLIVDVDYIMAEMNVPGNACSPAQAMYSASFMEDFEQEPAAASFGGGPGIEGFEGIDQIGGLDKFGEAKGFIRLPKHIYVEGIKDPNRQVLKINQALRAGGSLLESKVVQNGRILSLADSGSFLSAIAQSNPALVRNAYQAQDRGASAYYKHLTSSHKGRFEMYPKKGANAVIELSDTEVLLGGDGDGDGCVDEADAELLYENFGKRFSSGSLAERVDFNKDGKIDNDDYLILVQNWGQGCK